MNAPARSDDGPQSVGWDNADCRGTPFCPPRCPRFVDRLGTSLLVLPVTDAPVEPEDLLDLYDCGREWHSVSYPPYATRQSLADWLSGLLERGWGLVAFDGPVVAGHAILVPESSREPEFGVFVDPAYRGRGIAAELLRHAIAHAADAGLRGIRMEVEQSIEAMHAIATAHGFESVGNPSSDDRMGMVFYRPDLERSPVVDQIRLVSGESA